MWSSSTTRRREAALVFIPTNNKNSRFVSLTEEEEGAGWDLDGEVSASAAAAGSKRMSAVLGIHKDAENDIFMPNAGGIARRRSDGGRTRRKQSDNIVVEVGKNDFGSFVEAGYRESGRLNLCLARR